PNFGLLLLSATLPLYYTSFHFMAHAQKSIYNDVILWLIWVPVWFVLFVQSFKYVKRIYNATERNDRRSHSGPQ
ncbi:MAG: hypothetical protein AAF228_13645, partial [Pseudomonadota bacterium]